MKIENNYPPNYLKIQAVLNPPKEAIFCYGDTIYNPSGGQIYEDLQKHEEVHKKQQEKMKSVELWWDEYLANPTFRLEQELEAYSKQAMFLKTFLLYKDWYKAVNELATQLSTMYNIDISIQEAESKIRNRSKQ
jgi:hypothetical protein